VLDGNTLRLLHNGTVAESIEYGEQQLGSVTAMMEDFVRFLRGQREQLLCPFEKTRSFVAAVEGMFQSSSEVRAVPPQYVKRFPIEDTVATEIAGIDELLQEAAKNQVLLSDLKVPWAMATKPVSLPLP
jgi:hypothetical protein